MDDLKAKLEQVDDDIQALREVKMAIVQQIADSEVTYSIGDRFKGPTGCKCIIATTYRGVGMLYLATGCLSAGVYVVSDSHRITQRELEQFEGDKKTRYYDARKQCKC